MSQDVIQDDKNNFFLSFQLKKEQEMQKQMLWHTFQEKNKQLELQHKLQLEHKYQVISRLFIKHCSSAIESKQKQYKFQRMAEQKKSNVFFSIFSLVDGTSNFYHFH